MIETLLAICRASDVSQLRSATSTALDAAGFAANYQVTPINVVRGAPRLIGNDGFPDAWEAKYREVSWVVDPLPNIALDRGEPVMLHALPEETALTDEEDLYLQSLSEWDMDWGVGIVAYGPMGRAGFIGIGYPKSDAIAASPPVDLLRIIAQVAFQRYCDLIRPELTPLPALSPREIEVLARIAEGKSKVAIAAEMEVSKDTVDTYFRRIYAKLGVSERGAAVATAMTHGILTPADMRISADMKQRQPARKPTR